MSRRRQPVSTVSPLIWLVVVILILYFARAVLIPLALALTLNFLLTPMVMGLQRLRIPRVLAVAIVMLLSTAVVAGMGWVMREARRVAGLFFRPAGLKNTRQNSLIIVRTAYRKGCIATNEPSGTRAVRQPRPVRPVPGELRA